VNALHRILKRVEQLDYLRTNLTLEPSHEVLHNDSIGTGEKCQYLLDKMLLIRGKLFPISVVLLKINLLGRPKYSDALLVHLVEVLLRWLDRKQSIGHGCIYRGEYT
jgi:hypothetical protein